MPRYLVKKMHKIKKIYYVIHEYDVMEFCELVDTIYRKTPQLLPLLVEHTNFFTAYLKSKQNFLSILYGEKQQ